MKFFAKAAQKFGHFDSVHRLGLIYMEGQGGVNRDPKLAVEYLSVASGIGFKELKKIYSELLLINDCIYFLK